MLHGSQFEMTNLRIKVIMKSVIEHAVGLKESRNSLVDSSAGSKKTYRSLN